MQGHKPRLVREHTHTYDDTNCTRSVQFNAITVRLLSPYYYIYLYIENKTGSQVGRVRSTRAQALVVVNLSCREGSYRQAGGPPYVPYVQGANLSSDSLAHSTVRHARTYLLVGTYSMLQLARSILQITSAGSSSGPSAGHAHVPIAIAEHTH